MNLPNKLTMLRMILIPVMIAVYLLRNAMGPNVYWIMGIIFVVASFTDFLDGYIARKRNIVTTFGKFMDPLADKLLVMTALLIIADVYAKNLLGNMWMPFWVPLIILAREFIVTSVRLVAVNEGKVIAASNLGKAKTALTMLAIIWYLFVLPINFSDSLSLIVSIIGWTLMGGSVLMTLISGYDYVWKNRNIIFTSI
jgi:CDP-diacylglycerol---glycerol-3-phosphate 3-phosphatidyltransferase